MFTSINTGILCGFWLQEYVKNILVLRHCCKNKRIRIEFDEAKNSNPLFPTC